MSSKPRSRVRRFRAAAIILGLAFLAPGDTAQATMMQISGITYDIAQPGEYEPGEIVLKIRPGVKTARVAVLARFLEAKVKKSIPQYGLHLLTFQPAVDPSAQKDQIAGVIQALRAWPQVENAYPNYKCSIPKPVGPLPGRKAPALVPAPGSGVRANASSFLSGYQWHLHRLKFPFSLAPPSGVPAIAVIDTGVDASHPDLSGKVLRGYDFITDLADATTDQNGHGTHVAGIAAAKSGPTNGIMGVSSTSKILPVRVLDMYGSGSWFDLMAGIVWARAQPGVKVLMISPGTFMEENADLSSDYKVFQKVIDDTVNIFKKVVCVPAGNDSNTTLYYKTYYGSKYRPVPAYYPSAFTVAASQEVDCRAYFSNYNAKFGVPYNFDFNFVKIVAPGWQILSAYPGGQYRFLSSTAMAAAIVAGCAARVWAANPAYSLPSQVQQKLTTTGKALPKSSGFQPYPAAPKRVDLGEALGSGSTGLVGVAYDGASGRTLADVLVKAKAEGSATVTAVSNGAGFYTLTGLSAAKAYTLTFTKTGFSPFNYAAVYGGVSTRADILNDVPMPVFLNRTRPSGQWSVLLTHHSWHPGYLEAYYSYPSKPEWSPVNWNQTEGTYFATKVYQDGYEILHPLSRGNLQAPPYAALTHDARDDTNPGANVVIKPQGASVYRINGVIDPTHDDYDEWGNFKGAGVNGVAFIYYGSALKATVKAANGLGSGSFWQIAELRPNGVVTVLNRLGANP